MKRPESQRIPTEDSAELDALLALEARAGLREYAPPAVRRRLLAEVQFRAAVTSPPHRQLGMMLAGGLAGLLVAAMAIGGYFMLGHPHLFSPGSVARTMPSTGGTEVPVNGMLSPASDYVSLPYSDPSIANGTEATVRISVPSSQLMAWGVPSAGEEPNDDPVGADLVLGDDGLPRAIRIATETSSAQPRDPDSPQYPIHEEK